MIAAILRVSWLNLRRDRAALALTFVLPLVFFSIFSLVFGSLGEGHIQPIRTALVLPQGDQSAARIGVFLSAAETVEVVEASPPWDRDRALLSLRRGDLSAVVVLPQGFAGQIAAVPGVRPAVELLIDSSHPVASQLLAGTLQAAALEEISQRLPVELRPAESAATDVAPGIAAGPLAIALGDVLAHEGKQPSVAFFAAGIGVMFLLFAVSGRSAVLIEERERGVLNRMLSSRLRLSQLLFGRWLFLATLGALQVTLMFVWGSVAFGLELWTPRHLAGFAVMTVASAAAAAGFGLLLAVSSRTRAQLNGISVVAVLIMSALGGSMFPRFLMPESLQRLGLATFNAWALDGYHKVFWYEAPLGSLWPQLAVLAALALLFFLLAQLVAERSLRGWGGPPG